MATHQLILELNKQSWEQCWTIIKEAQKHDPELGYKINPIKEIKCADCDKDLTNIFCHYVIKKRTLCSFCRCQYNSKGIRN